MMIIVPFFTIISNYEVITLNHEPFQNILFYIEEAGSAHPDRIALADEHLEWSYGHLVEEIHHIGSGLASCHIHKAPVAIFLERSPACISAMLGVLCSGNYYAVIDIDMPKDRIQRILNTLKPKAIITDEDLMDRISLPAGEIPLLPYQKLLGEPVREDLLKKIRNRMIDTDPAYVLYTSGSTGTPKGAVISHRALISYSSWFIKAFSVDDTFVFGSQTPLYFSMSVSDLYGALRTGARYQIIPRKYFSFPMQLMEYMNQSRINTIYWVPSALSIVANWDTFRYARPNHLKRVLFAGEVMPNKQLNYWRRHFPDLLYANLFGPTETTDICSYYLVDREFADQETLPIGYACDNCGLMIVDDQGRESDRGELYVRGSFLADGYYNDPVHTEKAFVQNPLQSAYPEIVYRTGDLVERLEDGCLIYCGRKDFQIKHMGFRIELGEIEAVIGAMDSIKSCVCIYDQESDKIVLVYEGRVKKDALAGEISGKLPAYMRPNLMIRTKALPLNANGKIDRAYLKKHYQEL